MEHNSDEIMLHSYGKIINKRIEEETCYIL